MRLSKKGFLFFLIAKYEQEIGDAHHKEYIIQPTKVALTHHTMPMQNAKSNLHLCGNSLTTQANQKPYLSIM